MAISKTKGLPEKQTQVAFVFFFLQRRIVGLILMHGAQLAQHQPRERIEPRHAAHQAHDEHIPRMPLTHMLAFMRQHQPQLLIAHPACAHHDVVEEREGLRLIIQQRQLDTVLPFERHPPQPREHPYNREHQQDKRHSHPSGIHRREHPIRTHVR